MLTTEEDALAGILTHIRRLPPVTVPLLEAIDRFATQDLYATIALPPFDNSAMDGYAVVAESCAPGARLRVVGEHPAGLARDLSIKRGEAVRIFTGAPIPKGADAVVMQEETRAEGDEVIIETAVAPGEFIRRRGGDLTEGQKILSAGDPIHPQTIALLASQGLATVEVGGEARAAVISTGDELAAPGEPLRPGQLYESNSQLLQGMLRKLRVDVAFVAGCRDRREEIESALRRGSECDLMIISGGVSVGAHDLVKDALANIGATLDLWRVSVKPGKPFLFGRAGNCAVFGLPGNPVSAFVTFLLFVRPAILRMMGAADSALSLPQTTARLNEAIENPGDRPHYVRGVLHGGAFAPIGRQESHALFGLSRANALALLRPGEKLAAASDVDVLTWE